MMFFGGLLLIAAGSFFSFKSNIHQPERTVWLQIGMVITGAVIAIASVV